MLIRVLAEQSRIDESGNPVTKNKKVTHLVTIFNKKKGVGIRFVLEH